MTPAMAGLPYMHFFSLLTGQAEGSVMFVPCYDNPVMYDIDVESVAGVPLPSFPKQSDSISLSMAGPPGRVHRQYHDNEDGQQQLYVISRGNGDDDSFEVLNYRRTGFFPGYGQSHAGPPWWSWKPLPSPPLYGPAVYPPDIGRKVFSPSAARTIN